MSEINVAQQYGISYLPLMLMEEQKLIEKHREGGGRRRQGRLGEIRGRQRDERRAACRAAFRFASGGVAPFVTLWSRTRGNLDVKRWRPSTRCRSIRTRAIPSVKTIKDFSDKDRIALPAVKVSIRR